MANEAVIDKDFVNDNEVTMETEFMLTTIDNPFDYFEQFIPWLMFDIEKGYQSCERLARFVNDSDDMTQKERNAEIERAIDEIILYDPFNIYKKVSRQVPVTV